MSPNPPGPLGGSRTTQKIADGKFRYEQRANTCGKQNCKRCFPDTGPVIAHPGYWYMCFPHKGKWVRLYLGKTLDTKRFRQSDGEVDWPAIAAHRAEQKTKRKAKQDAKAGIPPSAAVAEADASPPGEPPAVHHCYACNQDVSPGSALFGQRAGANLCGPCHANQTTPEADVPLSLPPPAGAESPKTQEAPTAP